MTVTGVRCAECKEVIVSAYRHDWHTCGCGATFVDGGRDYLRYGVLREGVDMPEEVEIP